MAISIRPRLTHAPWAGFSKHDCPRDVPLPICPSPLCRRLKDCTAAHDQLYCQRTHFSPREQKKLGFETHYDRAVEAVLRQPEETSLPGQIKRMLEIQIIRVDEAMEMTDRWKAGKLDHIYGPYRKKGVVVRPPPLCYVEEPRRLSSTHTRVSALG